MNGAQIGVVCTVILALLGVVGLVITVRDRASKQAQDEQARIDKAHAAGFQEGRESRNDEVRLLTSQRDDARRDRDLFQAQSDEGWRRYNDLRDKGQR